MRPPTNTSGHAFSNREVVCSVGIFIALRFRAPRRSHDFNIARHSAKIGGQLVKEVALPDVGRKPADEGAVLGFREQLFEPCLQVFRNSLMLLRRMRPPTRPS